MDLVAFAHYAAGPAGAITAVLFMRDTPWQMRLALTLAGCALAYYLGPFFASFSRIEGSLDPTSYIVGLVGMAAVRKTLATLEAFDSGTIIRKLAYKILGIVDDEPRNPVKDV